MCIKRFLLSVLLFSLTAAAYSSGMDKNIYNSGITLYKQGLYARSANEFKKAVVQYPHSSIHCDALFYAAKSYYAIKNYRQSIFFFSHLKRKARNEIDSRRAIFGIAQCYYNMQNYAYASAYFSDFANKYVDSPVAHAAHYYAGLCNDKLGKTEKAILHYRTIISRYPDSRYVAFARSRAGNYLNNYAYEKTIERTVGENDIVYSDGRQKYPQDTKKTGINEIELVIDNTSDNTIIDDGEVDLVVVDDNDGNQEKETNTVVIPATNTVYIPATNTVYIPQTNTRVIDRTNFNVVEKTNVSYVQYTNTMTNTVVVVITNRISPEYTNKKADDKSIRKPDRTISIGTDSENKGVVVDPLELEVYGEIKPPKQLYFTNFVTNVITDYQGEGVVITNRISLTTTNMMTNTIISTQMMKVKVLDTNELILDTYRDKNKKASESVNRYQTLLEIKARLLKMKEDAIKKKENLIRKTNI